MSWKRFLLVVLPIAIVILGLAAEGVAIILEDIQPRRHDLDRAVAALSHAQRGAPIVLVGDSVTQDVAKSFALAPRGHIVNLTTNKASGLIGSVLLLQRYLDASAMGPQVVAIASTPEFFAYQPEEPASRLYLTSVFRRAGEVELLGLGGVEGGRRGEKPAGFDLEWQIGTPLTGVLASDVTELPSGDIDPNSVAYPAPGTVLDDVKTQIEGRRTEILSLSRSSVVALHYMCAIAKRKGFKIILARAPMPASVNELRHKREADMWASIKRETLECPSIGYFDFNSISEFPDEAFRDGDHLRRPDWTALYSRKLVDWIGKMSR